MKVHIDCGAVKVTQGNKEVFTFDGISIEVDYSEQEFLALIGSYPKLIEALTDITTKIQKGA